jgi:hypothetical protein
MTDYTKTTDFAAKDSLPSGDTGKIIRGAEFETEFDNISTSIATKADLASPTFSGTATIPTAAVTTLNLGNTDVTATAAELNILDGVTADATELNILDGATVTTDELNLLDGVTATTAELNYLDVTTLGTVEASKVVTAASNGNVRFPDTERLTFGASNDLSIFHDGSNSYIDDSGTGNLLIRADDSITLKSYSGTGVKYLEAVNGGEVRAYHNNNLKFATKSTGVDITGALNTDNGATISKPKASGTDSVLIVIDDSDPNVENRLTTFQRNNGSGSVATVGGFAYNTIGSDLTTTFVVAGTAIGLGFFSYITTRQIIPTDQSGSELDDSIDLGRSSARFDDIYATNSTIQTSDINEKQDIDVLSDAEQRVAVAAKGLLKKFRWRSAVEEKGDNARIHFGIIAQDLQAAFQEEGLDAGRYGMFVSETWTDPETNEERSRMGVRYSELLAFIISAI